MDQVRVLAASGDLGEMVDPETGCLFEARFECEAALRVADEAAFAVGTQGMADGELDGWIASKLAAELKRQCAELIEGSSVTATRLLGDARALFEPAIGTALDASVSPFGLRFVELRRFSVTSPEAEGIRSARAEFAAAAAQATSGRCKACGVALGITANFCFACGARQ